MEYQDSYDENEFTDEEGDSPIAQKLKLHQRLAIKADALVQMFKTFPKVEDGVKRRSPEGKKIILWIFLLDQIESNLQSLLGEMGKHESVSPEQMAHIQHIHELVLRDIEGSRHVKWIKE